MAERIINSKFCLRTDSAENWNVANPILLRGELGIEEDTGKIKVGDGKTLWTDLIYFFASSISRQEIFDLIYPINSVLTTVSDTNPSETIGGIWRESKVIAITELKHWVRVE